MVIAIILSSLALLAAITAVGLCLWERKRSQKRNTAMLQIFDESCVRFDRRLKDLDKETESQIDGLESRLVLLLNELENRLEGRLKELESGAVPDYEKAKEAANAVNNFNAGITGILGFDPYAALQAQRDQDRGGERQ